MLPKHGAVLILMSLIPVFSMGATAQPVGVVAVPVKVETISDSVEALGTLKANESVEMTVNIAEIVQRVLFESGQRVRKGDILVEMESAEERAVLQEAQYTLDEARSQLDRIRAVAQRGDASQSLLDEKQREFYVSRARVAAIQSRLQNRIVKAPFDGVVGLRNVSAGAYVAPGELITTLIDDSRMKLDFNVPSIFLSSLKPGIPITASSRAFEGKQFIGVVESVDNKVDPVSRSVTVRAVLPNPDATLKPGLLMEVDLLTNQRSSMLVPEEAIVQHSDTHFVYVLEGKDEQQVATRRDVNIGVRLNGNVEILSGIKAGENVVTHGALKIQSGSTVSLLERAVGAGK
jgi:membrane fusion protein (multidrug efflux system)